MFRFCYLAFLIVILTHVAAGLAFLIIIQTHVAADELHQAGHVRHEEGGGQGQTRLFGSSEAALRGEDLLDDEIDLIFEYILFYRC